MAAAAQEPEGLWLQRHWTTGSLAPSWCTPSARRDGAILYAYEAAWRRLRDGQLDDDLWPSAQRAADFLLGTIDEDGLPVATADLWEERDGRHAFTAAAICGGLRAAASMARRHEPSLAGGYDDAAEIVREAIEREHWSDFHGRYLRSLGDPSLDVSLLGLAWPFAAVDPGGERMRATVTALQKELGCPAGSLRRYEGDTYAGGNRWVLAALWLGLWHRQIGDADGMERALTYALSAQTELGLLPEQVTDDGEPAWVVPLAWSHAMLLLAARPEVDGLSSRLASAAWASSRFRSRTTSTSRSTASPSGASTARTSVRRRPLSRRRRARSEDHAGARRRTGRTIRRAIEPVVRKLLGLELDLPPFRAFAQSETVLAETVVRFPGFRPPLAPDPFEALVSSITAQQVSLHAAFAIRSRFIERYGEPGKGERAIAFPTRERVALADEDELSSLGFSRRKAEYVLRARTHRPRLRRARDASRRGGEGTHHLASWARRVERRLVLARHLGRPNAWPAGDLGPAQGSARVLP